MKVEKTYLAQRLNKIRGAVSQKTVVTAMAGILFENNRLIANNLDIAMVAELGTNTNECFIIPMNVVELINKLLDGSWGL